MKYRSERNLKEQGIYQAAKSNAVALIKAREIARLIGSQKGTCSIEDVRDSWSDFPGGNWTGAVFRTPDWQYLKHIPSRHKNGHARSVSLWQYKSFNGQRELFYAL